VAFAPDAVLPAIGDKIEYPVDDVDGPFEVVGASCAEEFVNQTRRWNPEHLLEASIRASRAVGFFRVTAEWTGWEEAKSRVEDAVKKGKA